MRFNGFYKYRKLIIAAVIIVIVLGCIFEGYNILVFHVTGTDPGVNSVSTLSPFLKVNFNKELSTKNIVISSPSRVINVYQVKGKTVIISLSYPLTANKTYSIDIPSIYDSAGAKLSNLVFTFKPTDIPFNKLTKDEQAALINGQDRYNAPGSNITYVNTNVLTNDGLSTTQLALLQKYFSEYKPSAKTITFDPNSIGVYAGTPPDVAMFKFIVNIDGTNYNAEAGYTFLNNLSLDLYDSQTGSLVFDSANYNGP